MSTENGKEKKPFSVKEFFKSTSFKCIAVLLAIVLVCGILLTICNSLFEVTEQEKLDRVLSQIYGKNVSTEEVDLSELETEFEKGQIETAYKVKDDGNYLISSTGSGGFSGGTATCWVVVEMTDGAISGIGNVVVSGNSGQSWINKVPQEAFEHFGEVYEDGESFDISDWTNADNKLTGGATGSTTAIVNSVNTALDFVRSQLLGETIATNPFENFDYIDYIDGMLTEVSLAEDNTSVNYKVVTTNYGISGAFTINITVNSEGVITAYTIPEDGYGTVGGYESHMAEKVKDGTLFVNSNAEQILKLFGQPTGENGGFVKNDITDETLVSGASESGTTNAGFSNFLCVYAALFAASNYNKAYAMALENSVEYTDYIDLEATTYSVDGDNLTYKVVTTSYGISGAFTINITVNSEGVITAYTIPEDGYGTVGGYESHMAEKVKDGTLFVNSNAEQILKLFGQPTGESGGFVKNDITDETLVSGASESGTTNAGFSNFLCVYAALFAASNYDTYFKIAEVELSDLMAGIYGEAVTVEAVDISGFTATVGKGTVNSVYKVSGTDNYIVNATGSEGFQDGTVTCWIVVETENGAVSGIKNVVIAGNDKQSFIANITDATLGHFSESFGGSDFTIQSWTDNKLTGGATYTTTAIINSVNSAKNFVAANLAGTTGGAQE